MLRLHLYLQLPLLHGFFLLKHIIHVEIIQQHNVMNRCVRCERPEILNPAVVMDPTMKGHPKLVGAEPVSSSKKTMVIVTSYEKNVLDWSQPKNCRGLLMHLPSRASKKTHHSIGKSGQIAANTADRISPDSHEGNIWYLFGGFHKWGYPPNGLIIME